MGFLGKFVAGSAIATAILAFCLYDPYMPEGLEDVVPYAASATFRLGRIVGAASSFLGFEKNHAFTGTLEFMANLKEPMIEGVSFKEDVFGNSVRVRIYTPDDKGKKALPGVVYYHGGGWCLASTKSYHSVTKLLAKKLNAVVVSVEYRLAPQHVFPAAVDDGFDATKYFIENAQKYGVDPKRIVVMGDSAGGNLATVVSLKLRDRKFKPMPKLQVLFYPVTQMLDLDTPSYRYNAFGPFLTRKDMGYFFSSYLFATEDHSNFLQGNGHVTSEVKAKLAKKELNLEHLPKDDIFESFKSVKSSNVDGNFWKKYSAKFLHPDASPLMAEDLRALPEAYISSCQYDVLRDDSYFYAHRLREAKVPVEHVNLHACYHAWLGGVATSKQAEADLDDIVAWIKKRL